MKNPQIGCLWVRKSQNDGSTYMSGVIEKDMVGALFIRAIKEEKDIRIVCFRADKKNDKMPDFKIILSEPQEAKVANDSFGDLFPQPVQMVKPISDEEIPVIEEKAFGTDDGEQILVDQIPF